MSRTNGITLIALVITIIVLLILAGVTIAVLTGDNGVLNKSKESKIENEIGKEKEQLSLAMTSMRFEDEKVKKKRKEIFQGYLDEYTGVEKTKSYITDAGYTVHFIETNRVYKVDEKGEIIQEDISIISDIDDNPGVLEIEGNKKIINSIEDLVEFSNQVNTGNKYGNDTIYLGKTLDFSSELSYGNLEKRYKYDETTMTYVQDQESEYTLIELMNDGIGFIPIGVTSSNGFGGNFDGQYNEIKNIYVNQSGPAGFFAYTMGRKTIKNLTIDGKITSSDSLAAGICASAGFASKIENCVCKARVTGNNTVGGICAVGDRSYF